jgi:A/G-specific adenine glycosylase
MKLTSEQISDFQEIVWEYFRTHQRNLLWREDPSAYNVLVSEIMLQQTQVPRVTSKFVEFMARFPDVYSLAQAPLADVLTVWSGLGYNRRAKFLHEAAKKIIDDYGGNIPATQAELMTLPGIGSNTAGAILAYVYDRPVTYIETNIRTVLFHHFFADESVKVSDKELRELAEQVLDRENPREWYWALMDYGTHLKKTSGGRLEQSKHYKKQPLLKGSLREMRGRILKTLTAGSHDEESLRATVQADERYIPAIEKLASEGLIVRAGDRIGLTGQTDAR